MRVPRSTCFQALALGGLGLLAPGVAAESHGMGQARVIELADGGFALETSVSLAELRALRAPVVPERFVVKGRPSCVAHDEDWLVRYEYEGSPRALGAGDVLFLPWADAVLHVAASWNDGSVASGLFASTAAGPRIEIGALRKMQRSYLQSAFRVPGEGRSELLRLLLVGAVVAASGARAMRHALVLVFGHALAIVLLAFGLPVLPPPVADLGLALGALLFARAGSSGDARGLLRLALVVGLVDGLGLASSGSVLDDDFAMRAGSVLMLDVAQLACFAVLSWLVSGRSPRWIRGFALATGVLVVAFMLHAFEVRSGGTPRVGSPGEHGRLALASRTGPSVAGIAPARNNAGSR